MVLAATWLNDGKVAAKNVFIFLSLIVFLTILHSLSRAVQTYILGSVWYASHLRRILSTEGGFYIYDRPLIEINVIASFCVLNLWIQFAVLKQRLLQRTETEASFCFNNQSINQSINQSFNSENGTVHSTI